MEVELLSFTIIFSSFTFLLFIVLKLATSSKTKHKSILKLPPGPKKLPFIGNLHLLATSRPTHRTLADLATKYGGLMHLQLGEISTLVVSSPEYAKEILRTHDINFAGRPSLLSTEIVCYGNTDIAFAPYGAYWRALRKICTLELLSMRRVQSFRPIREEECTNLCRWIASNAGHSINLTERLYSTIYDVITRATLGKKTEEEGTFVSVIKDAFDVAAGFHLGDVYPSVKLFSLISGMTGRLERLHRRADRILENIINQHKVASDGNRGDESEKTEDLVDVLLKFQDSGFEVPLTTDNIKSVLLDMFSAGSETSATTVDWAMAEMMKNPSVLQKAQEEVRQVFDKKGYIDESEIDELKWLKSVINETFRMHPPGPMLIPRENKEPCEINGYKIPAKTRVIVSLWAIGRDPRYWEDAESFKPERFFENSSSFDYKGNNFQFIPFGSGRRICPGISFGMANVELLLAMLLYHFDWILPNGMKPEEMDMAETLGMSARRKKHMFLIPVVRKPCQPIKSKP